MAILLIFYATDRSSKNICGLSLSRSFERHVVTMVTVTFGNSPSFWIKILVSPSSSMSVIF